MLIIGLLLAANVWVAIMRRKEKNNQNETGSGSALAEAIIVLSIVDVLFIGAALYAYGIDSNMKEYLKTLKKSDAKKAVVFSTSWISKHSIDILKKGLEDAGITVESDFFYVKGKDAANCKGAAKEFASRFC